MSQSKTGLLVGLGLLVLSLSLGGTWGARCLWNRPEAVRLPATEGETSRNQQRSEKAHDQLSAAAVRSLQRAGFVPATVLRPAPTFDLRDAATGKALTLADLRGQVVLLNFWGTSCPHCLKAFPQLERLAKQFSGRGLVVVCVCADETEVATVNTVARRYASGLSVFVDPQGWTRLRYDVQVLPTTHLLDTEGRLVGYLQGDRDWLQDEVSDALTRLLPSRP